MDTVCLLDLEELYTAVKCLIPSSLCMRDPMHTQEY